MVPGLRDIANLEGKLRRDAPTGSRLAQHLLFILAAWHVDWMLISGDVKSAFLKGDPYSWTASCSSAVLTNESVQRFLWLQASATVRKGIFGLADAP